MEMDMENAMAQYGTQEAGWVVLPLHEAYEEAQVFAALKEQIDLVSAEEPDVLALNDCTAVGLDIAAHADGTLFVTLLYR